VKALPRPLAPWAEELARFGEEARQAIGPWLPTLERLLGPHARDRPDEDGEPDGLAGLGRRGRYERLALSEWSLLDVAPEEFLRRAGAGEHLFHQIARSTRAGGQRLVVLFDAGPLQLGTPRLVHLAWLLVLLRRALRTRTRLYWGVLQMEPAQLREGDDPGALRALLAARSPHPARPAHVQAWAAQLGPAPAGEERWLVAAAPDRAHEQVLGAVTLAVAEPDHPGQDSDRLRVEVAHPGGAPGRALLRLPANEVCARLLRDPFPRARGGPLPDDERRLAAGAQFSFAANGKHIIARLAGGDLIALAVSPREHATQPLARFQVPSGQVVVAAGWRKRKMYVATVHGDVVWLHVGRDDCWQSSTREVKGGAPLPRSSPALLPGLAVDGDTFWFADVGWRLYHGFLSGGYLFTVPESVLTWAWAGRRMTTLGRVGSGPLEVFVHRRNGLDRVALAGESARASDGHLDVDSNGTARLVAVGTGGDGRWRLHQLGSLETRTITLAPGTPVYGVTRGRHGARIHGEGAPCLLVRTSDERMLELVNGVRPFAVLPFDGAVEHAALQPGGAIIAAQVEGELHLVDGASRARRVLWGRRPS
jgi:hypothetical protein